MNSIDNSRYGDNFVRGMQLICTEDQPGALRGEKGMKVTFLSWNRCGSAGDCGRGCMTGGKGIHTSRLSRCSGWGGVWHWEGVEDEHLQEQD